MIETEIATYIERQFLKTLEGVCSANWTLARYNEEEDTIQGFYFRLTEKKKLKLIKLFLSKNGRLGFICSRSFE
jgi:hydroxymethylbilane synthase